MATIIYLWGELGERFQPSIKLEVGTFREARLALCTVFPGFKHYVLEHPEYQYSVVAKGVDWERELTIDHDYFPIADAELHIVPVLEGSGKIGQLIGGLALIGIGIATGGIGLIVAGAAMFLQGAFGNKAKPPSESDRQSRFLSQGNLATAEGNVIPVICGHVLLKNPQAVSYRVDSARQS